MATELYVPVAGDDWYQRRRDDPEGEFFRKVADQGPRRGVGGGTRQGIYMLTASGKLLAFKNHHDPEVMREVLRQGLAAWRNLPVTERRPGVVKIEDLPNPDPRYTRTPPEGGLIVSVYTRILDRDAKDGYCRGSCGFPGGDAAARDHLWLTRDDWQSLIPAEAKKGDEYPLPARLAERILRFHLVDNTRGEPTFWRREDIRDKKLTLTMEEATSQVVRLRLAGKALLATAANPAQAERGYEVELQGIIRYDVTKQAIDRITVVAVGDHWGRGVWTPEPRLGRKPLGIVFELSPGDKPADRVPPEAARNLDSYLGRGE
jgi:hypothetical protein